MPQQPLSSATGALPAEAPQGTDPELWSVLTGEERAFFAKAAQSGPLTYSRISAGVRAAWTKTMSGISPESHIQVVIDIIGVSTVTPAG